MHEPFLKVVGISKSYLGVKALDAVSFHVAHGEVIGLVGENGAGKSTLMNILGGVTSPSAGTLVLDGHELSHLTVADSMRGGIAFVHQELNLFENLTAADNIFIGREPLKGGPLRLVDEKKLKRLAEPLLAQLGADFAAETPVASLSLAQMQMVEIAKALSLNARLIIMDEPTSSLTATETRRLLDVIARLKTEGVSIILISHRLAEIEEAVDRVVVLRDGKCVGELERADARADTMIRLMIGRDLKKLYRAPSGPPGEALLQLDGVRTAYRPEQPVSLDVRKGEILGLAGLVGSGRTELSRAIFGLDPLRGGQIRIEGMAVAISSPHQAIRHGLYLIPEDRKRSGLILDFTICNNVTLASMTAHSRLGIVDHRAEVSHADELRRHLDIRTPSIATVAGTLSGGNQQKVVLAKWLSMAPRILIFDEPTRGVDVGAKNEIYGLMRALSDRGVGILMISSDMEEVIGISDRVAVMHEGRIAGFLARDDLSESAILSLAVGRTAA